MARPRASQKKARLHEKTRYLIVDGYVDEPASLGVPPYLSPQVRSLAGGLVNGGADEDTIGYITVDQWRDLRGRGTDTGSLGKLESVVIISDCVVPGKYLRGTPISMREIGELISESKAPLKVVTGSALPGKILDDTELHSGDPGILGYHISSQGRVVNGKAALHDWNENLFSGAFVASLHPDHPSPLICEIETSSGCPRYVTGGCSFCLEPEKGPVVFREPADVVKEVEALANYGVENVRIGGQSDLVSYLSPDVGKVEVPCPDPLPVSELMAGIKKTLHEGRGVKKAVDSGFRIEIDTGIVHTDNSNPAVIAEHPDESKMVLKAIIEGSTGGSVLALGLESSDPLVKERNNLNSTPDQVLESVRIMNELGRKYSGNGMPSLLPGINFLGGLAGQTPSSFQNDLDLLRSILDEDLMIRRINIRRVLPKKGERPSPGEFADREMERAFRIYREEVRNSIDVRFMKRMLPPGHIIKGIHTEAKSGSVTFGRQIGSYPVLAGIAHRVPMESKVDIVVTEVSSRSVTGFRTPFDLGSATYRDLTALPGIGRKRAATMFRAIGKENRIDGNLFPDHPWVLDHLKSRGS
jgi:radical SAM superfamily enzyme with C-terminal helix-hairpin-helix motif